MKSKMEYAPIHTIQATDADFLNFENFITKQELERKGIDDGVFKITFDSGDLSEGTPHSQILKWTTGNLKELHKQILLKGDSSDIFTYKKKTVSVMEKKMFKAEASVLSTFSEPTCCTLKLQNDGVPGLLCHYFEDIEKKVEPHYRSTKSDECTRQRAQIIRHGEAMRKAYEEGSMVFSKKSQSSGVKPCVCRDCEEENCLQVESNSDSEEELDDNAVYYAAGLSLRKNYNDSLCVTLNLNLSTIKNLLIVLDQYFDGVSSPFMYLGRKHSLFPIHNEDAALWSLNFLFFGAPKIWIVVKPVALMLLVHHLSRSGIALGNTSCLNILGHKVAFPTPQWLRTRRIPFKVVVQMPGEALVLYPNAAHFGFNCGYNVAQAVNFGTKSWIPHGINYPRCICLRDSVHMELSGLIAAFRPELLDKYLQNEYIPADNTKDMASYMAAALKSPTSKEHVKKCKKTPLRSDEQSLECPVASCKKRYCRDKKTSLVNHVKRRHKPLVDKLCLLKKIDDAHAALKLKLKN